MKRSRAVPGENDLATTQPKAAALWSGARNGETTTQMVTANTKQVAWWSCSEGHDWMESPSELVDRGSTCPICFGERTRPGVNDLATTHPRLAAQWQVDAFDRWGPEDINATERTSPTWRADCGHTFSRRVKDRVADPRCPECGSF